MVYWAIALAALAVIGAVFQHIKSKQLSAKVESLRQSLSRQTRKLEFVEEKLQQDLSRLNYEFKKETGHLRFTKDMTFQEALALNPKVEEVMGAMHVGGCPDCAVDLSETLAYGAAKNSVDVEEFLLALNNLPDPADQSKYKNDKAKIRRNAQLNVI